MIHKRRGLYVGQNNSSDDFLVFYNLFLGRGFALQSCLACGNRCNMSASEELAWLHEKNMNEEDDSDHNLSLPFGF